LDSDGKAKMRSVTTGRQDEHIVVIASGLDPGTTVVTSGFARLFDGAKVHVSHSEPQPAAAAEPSAAPAEHAKGHGGRKERDAKERDAKERDAKERDARGEGSPGR
jgi:membrane fusion protein, multidrug efflux system